MPTYTSSWFSVSDGDSTSHDPQTLASTTSPISVLSGQIRWEGVQTSSSSTSTDYSTNTNTTSATAYTSTTSGSDSNNDKQFGGVVATATFPSVPAGATFDYHRLVVEGDASNYDGSLTVSYEPIDGGTEQDAEVSGLETAYSSIAQSNYVGESRSAYIEEIGDGETCSVTAKTYYEDTTTNSDTSCTSYPSAPSGYSFDRHYWREEKNSSYVDSGYVYSNSVGDSRCVTSDSTSNTWDLEMETRGSDTTTTTTYYDTHDPSVSGDVSGSYTGTLTDGEQSAWQTLTGLTAGTSNTFNHSIQESNEAKYQFEFTWEELGPDPVHGTVGFYVNNEWKECAVADPTDTKLDYNHVLVYNGNQGVWGALDVVDPSDTEAIDSHQFYDSVAGWLAPRRYGTTQ